MRFQISPANLRRLAWGSTATILLLLSTRVLAEVPRAVSLLYFRGNGLDRAVSLEWATGTELNTAGYRLERAEASGGPFQVLNQIGVIPARGNSLQGAEYNATDRDSLQNGKVYWYKLIEIEFDGAENPIGPISVTAGYQEPTATSTSGSTAQPSATVATSSGTAASMTPSLTPTASTPTPNSLSTATATALTTSLSPAAANSSLTPPPQAQAPGALAQAGTPVSGTAYPGAPGTAPIPPAGTSATNQGYPPAGFESTALPPEPYPQSIEREDRVDSGRPVVIPTGTLAALIGEVPEALPTSQLAEPETTSSSSLLLWAGFLAALMIFVAAVIGSILYYRR
jgi:hypothetical protein